MRILASRRVRYPWAMAPTINTRKPVATAIATLYLARSRSARPLPSRLYRPCRSPQSLHSLRLRRDLPSSDYGMASKVERQEEEGKRKVGIKN